MFKPFEPVIGQALKLVQRAVHSPWFVGKGTNDPGNPDPENFEYAGTGGGNQSYDLESYSDGGDGPAVETANTAAPAIPTVSNSAGQWDPRDITQGIPGAAPTRGMNVKLMPVWDDGIGAGLIITEREGNGAALSGAVVVTPDNETVGTAGLIQASINRNSSGGEGRPSASSAEINMSAVPTDPLFGVQWHLRNTGQSILGVAGTPGVDVNVVDVWDDYTGAGVIIGDVDDGIEYTHPDLVAGINTAIDYDAVVPDNDAFAEAGENHATTVAGTIVATPNNGIGVAGVAYDAQVAGFRMEFVAGAENQTLANFQRQADVDISNNSWGYGGFFFDDFTSPIFQGIGNALVNAVGTGRGGLGTVFTFAAGNDRTDGQDVNYHAFQNSPYTITVAAIDNTGKFANFSTPGAAILVSAPGVDVATTDRVGGAGYASGDYVYASGTSYASPLTAGVVALMLEANSSLGYRDVQEILAYSARQIDAGSAGWAENGAVNWNGGGLHASHDYGFGLIDAHAAVRLAETWTAASTLSNLSSVSVLSAPGLAIPDFSGVPGEVSDTITVANGLMIDHVGVRLELDHTFIGDLTVTLTSPDGTASVLVNRPPTGQDDIRFDLFSTQFWGETGGGDWTLNVRDSAGLDVGTLESWELILFGDPVSDDSLYIFTDEFANYAGADPSEVARRTLVDGAGIDTVNAAAVTSDTILNLTPGAFSSLAGNSLIIGGATVIENAFLGDGNDQAIGNAADNVIDGGRGNDVLYGGVGADTLLGGMDNDIYLRLSADGSDVIDDAGGTDFLVVDNMVVDGASRLGADLVLGLTGGETLRITDHYGVGTVENLVIGNAFYQIRTDLIGDAAGDLIAGTSGADQLSGGGGGDLLFGSLGADTILGGDGDDFLFGGDDGDILYGGVGADALLGGLGDDSYLRLSADGTDIINDAGGTDTLIVDGFVVQDASRQGSDLVLALAGGGALGITDHYGAGTVESLVIGSFSYLMRTDLVGGAGSDLVAGTVGADLISGGAGGDMLFGGAGGDTLAGGTGDDFLFGGDGDDLFQFANGDGNDMLFGFTAGAGGVDEIDVSGFGFANFADVIAAADDQGGLTDVTIALDADDAITLAGLHIADLTDSDFLFL